MTETLPPKSSLVPRAVEPSSDAADRGDAPKPVGRAKRTAAKAKPQAGPMPAATHHAAAPAVGVQPAEPEKTSVVARIAASAKSVDPATKANLVKAGIGIGIGSAAIVAALLYSNQRKKRTD